MPFGELIVLNIVIGLLSAFSPCLFPLLPSYVALTLRSNQSRTTTFFSSFALIGGILTVFFSLGLVANLIGQFLLRNYSLFARIQGGLLIVAGLIMIKTPNFIYRISLPDSIENKLFNSDEDHNPLLFSYLVGLLFTIIAAPCASGYFLVAWTSLIGQNLINQFLLVIAFSLGAGFPFVLMSILTPELKGDIVGKVRQTSAGITIVLGMILVAVGAWLFIKVTPLYSI